MRPEIQLVWFKRDLRVADQAALSAAASAGPVLPLYVVEPGYWAGPDVSARQYEFLIDSLRSLDAALRGLGQPLWIAIGEVTDVLADLRSRYRITAVHSSEESGNAWTYDRDRRVRTWLRDAGIEWVEHRQFGVVRGMCKRERWATQWDALMAEPMLPCPALRSWTHHTPDFALTSPHNLGLQSDHCPGRQRGGIETAHALLASFLTERGRNYQREMSSPISAARACSRLSAHLSLGCISLRTVHQSTVGAQQQWREQPLTERGLFPRSLSSFNSRLHWHCHFIQKLESEPAIEFHNINRAFDGLRPESPDPDRLQRWAQGQTGWPFVDACMRQLQATGWINFRMRAMLMAVSSYHLWQPWREPGLHLARLFTDYEPGIHWAQTQMQSGVTGINIPRIYNPIKQGLDQDPAGDFVRHWIPELTHIPGAAVHRPWLLGTQGARTYPAPIADHEQAARDAKAKLTLWRQRDGLMQSNAAVMAKHGSRKRRLSRTVSEASPQLGFKF